MDGLIRVVDALSGAPVSVQNAFAVDGVGRVESRPGQAVVLLLNARSSVRVRMEANGYAPLIVELDRASQRPDGYQVVTAAMMPAPGAPLSPSTSFFSGRVVEATTGRPLADAELEVQGLPSGAATKFQSISGGYFLAAWPASTFKGRTKATRTLRVSARVTLDGRLFGTTTAVPIALVPKQIAEGVNSWRAAAVTLALVELAKQR